jgi:A/G-specific adenine glycosylase
MLQQTQVSTVIPYFERWMARFPDPAALAAAPEEDVLRAWAGLGYYARARNLQKAAQALVGVLKTQGWPANVEAWKGLPGIGEYTAGAVNSLAFGRSAPILDGNVVRVFSRLLGLDFLPGDGAEAKRAYWELASQWADHKAPDAVNEGLMELGALVCAPSSPRCGECPLAAVCAAQRENRQADLPPARKRVKIETVRGVAVRASLGKKVLTERRGRGAFLAGHEMFPLFLGAGAEEARALFEQRFPALRVSHSAAAGRVTHAIMSKRYEIEILDFGVRDSRRKPAAADQTSGSAAWTDAVEVAARLTNALARKIWKAGRPAD